MHSLVLLLGAATNLATGLPLAIPGLDAWALHQMAAADALLGGSGAAIALPGGPVLLLVRTAGLMLVVVGLLLLWTRGAPMDRRALPLINAAGRLAWAALVAAMAFGDGLPRPLWLAGAWDVVLAVLFIWLFRLPRRA